MYYLILMKTLRYIYNILIIVSWLYVIDIDTDSIYANPKEFLQFVLVFLPLLSYLVYVIFRANVKSDHGICLLMIIDMIFFFCYLFYLFALDSHKLDSLSH